MTDKAAYSGNGAHVNRADPQLVAGEPIKTQDVREHKGIRWLWASEIVPNFMEPGLIDGVLDQRGMTVLFGPSSSGKTALAVDLAACIAAGRPWRGNPVQRGLVVYVAAENSESTKRRFWAWMRHHKIEQLAVMVVVSPMRVSEKAIAGLTAAIEAVVKESGLPARMVVFDTLARTLEGDENDAEPVGRYVHCLDLVQHALNCHVMVVHHTGKDERRGARGSSALRAATDHELSVKKAPGQATGTLELTKVREGDLEGARLGFKLEQVKLGRNSIGREVTTIVVEPCEAPVHKKRASTGGAEARVADALEALSGQRVTLEEFKEMVGDLSTGNRGTESKAWSRILQSDLFTLDRFGYVVPN